MSRRTEYRVAVILVTLWIMALFLIPLLMGVPLILSVIGSGVFSAWYLYLAIPDLVSAYLGQKRDQ